ncbi:MAG TPA: ATP-binding protein [Thermoanaerobaculia bacterium]
MRVVARYSTALLATFVALVLTAALPGLLAPMRLFFFWCAVLVTAVLAGFGPAVVAIGLSVAGAAYLVFEPTGSLLIHGATDITRATMFALFAGGISVVASMRRRAEERARVSELRYRTLIEATPVPQAVWTADANGVIAWPDAWLEITGQSRREVERDGGFGNVHPEDAPHTAARWRTAVAEHSYYSDEIRVRVKNGRYRWFAIKAVPLRSEDGRYEWVGSVADVHDRKQHAEEAAFVNRASEVLASSLGFEQTLRNLARLCVPAIADSCAIDIGTDAEYERIVVEHADPARVELIREFDRKSRGVSADHPVLRVLLTGRTELIDDVKIADRELAELAKALHISSAAIVPMKARGRIVGALSLVYNESGRHYSEDDLPLFEEIARRAAMALDNARLYEAAEAANRAKDEFLATLSHELRTPLTAISGWANMLQLGLTDEQTSRLAIDTIVSSARAQGELIDDLLDLSSVVAGTLQLHVDSVDLVKLVGEIALAARPAADAKGLTLEVAQPDRPLVARGDARRVRQIVWNLVTNAVKFTESGGSVRIALSEQARHARVEITDTGRGIEPDFLPYVWDRFRQADSSTSRQYGGLGLGLSVVRHLVELHGGTVGVTSEGLGRGATFTVDLPLAARDTAASAGIGPADHRSLLQGRRVLVVDDDRDTRLLLVAMLRQYGVDVVATASVDEALTAFADTTFDIVVSDIAMPTQDGYALLRRLRDVSQTPVVAVSAIASGPLDRQRAIDAGFADFVRKPIDPAQLASAVAAALG